MSQIQPDTISLTLEKPACQPGGALRQGRASDLYILSMYCFSWKLKLDAFVNSSKLWEMW